MFCNQLYRVQVNKVNEWPNFQTIGMVESKRTIGNKTSTEKRFFISSMEPKARHFANAVREHWAIENSLHWVLNVSFREDDSRIRRDYSSENISVFRHIVLNALRNDKKGKKSIKAKQFKTDPEPGCTNKTLSGLL